MPKGQSSKQRIAEEGQESVEVPVPQSVLEDQIDQEELSMERMREILNLCMKRISELEAQVTDNPSRSHPSSTACKKPDAYFGSPEKLEIFITRLETFLESKRVPEGEKVKVASTYLEGNALYWFRLYQTKTENPSFPEFINELRAAFKDVDEIQKARDDLFLLKQGDMNICDYVAKFQELIMKIGIIDPMDKIDKFTRGLNLKPMQEIRMRKPQTLEEAISLAKSVEGSIQTCNAVASSSSSSSKKKKSSKKKSIQCFRCKKFGHIAPECRQVMKSKKEKVNAAETVEEDEAKDQHQ